MQKSTRINHLLSETESFWRINTFSCPPRNFVVIFQKQIYILEILQFGKYHLRLHEMAAANVPEHLLGLPQSVIDWARITVSLSSNRGSLTVLVATIFGTLHQNDDGRVGNRTCGLPTGPPRKGSQEACCHLAAHAETLRPACFYGPKPCILHESKSRRSSNVLGKLQRRQEQVGRVLGRNRTATAQNIAEEG